MKRLLFIAALVLLLPAAVLGWRYASEEYLVACTDDTVVFSVKAEEGMRFATRFIHSVHRAPVIDRYIIADGEEKIVQVSTAYQAYGVGMPYLPEDGTFVQKDGFFELTDLDLAFRSVDYRVGREAQFTILFDEREYPIYQLAPQGALVRLTVEPRYRIWLK